MLSRRPCRPRTSSGHRAMVTATRECCHQVAESGQLPLHVQEVSGTQRGRDHLGRQPRGKWKLGDQGRMPA